MKAIITDLDRTLLHSDKSVSQYTIDVLEKCRAQGIRILAASARPLRDIHIYNELIKFDAITATNGAVVELPTGKLELGISCDSGKQILANLLCFPDIFLSIETSRGLFSNRDIPVWKPIVYDKFPELPNDIILYKILASSEHKGVYESIEQFLTGDVYHTIANEELIQIMSLDATKWNGIRHMLDYFSIAPADAVYFGDDNDDIEALKKCGLGIAVANAIPAVLEAADYITESNDLDGVAKYILEKIIDRKEENYEICNTEGKPCFRNSRRGSDW